MKSRFLALTATASLLLAACTGQESETTNQTEPTTAGESQDTLTIYSTVYPIQYFAERIGGEYVEVASVYPPGADEHTFEPTQQDMVKFAEGDLLLSIGLGLESFISSAKDTLANQNVEIVELADAISDETILGEQGNEEEGHEEESHEEESHEEENHEEEGSSDGHDSHGHGALDPHLWISPTLSIELAKVIKEELIEKSPEQEQTFEENFAALEADLQQLDQSFRDMVDNASRDTFFVSHAAFGYWERDYGLEQIAVSGFSTQDQPSQKELADLVDQAREEQITYILTEQNVSSKLTDIIRTEIGAETLPLHNLSVLTDEDVAANETYLTLMERNIETLEKALQ